MGLVSQSREVHKDAGGKEERASEQLVSREELLLEKLVMNFYLTFPQSDFEVLGGMPHSVASDHQDSLGLGEQEVVFELLDLDGIYFHSRLSEMN